MEYVFYDIPDKCSKFCSMSQYFTGKQASFEVSKCFTVMVDVTSDAT